MHEVIGAVEVVGPPLSGCHHAPLEEDGILLPLLPQFHRIVSIPLKPLQALAFELALGFEQPRGAESHC